jgi:hypothetical protein
MEIKEVQIINTFILATKRERYAGFVSSPKNRKKFVRELYHFTDFDPDAIVHMPSKFETIEGILNELRARGANETCYVISVDNDLDGMTLSLSDAFQRVFAYVEGTIISCGPKLAYYEGEAPNNRFILHRQTV